MNKLAWRDIMLKDLLFSGTSIRSSSLSKSQHLFQMEMKSEDRSSSSDSDADGTLSSCPSFLEIKIPSKVLRREEEPTKLRFRNICCVGAGYVGMSTLLKSLRYKLSL